MTESERLAHNFLARACWLLVAIRQDLLQYPNDSVAAGFVCDINDFFSETYSWLKENSPPPPPRGLATSAPTVATSGPGSSPWKAPTSGPSSATPATPTPNECLPPPETPVPPPSASPEASTTRRFTSPLLVDFF